jgi:hypothetical protein
MPKNSAECLHADVAKWAKLVKESGKLIERLLKP